MNEMVVMLINQKDGNIFIAICAFGITFFMAQLKQVYTSHKPCKAKLMLMQNSRQKGQSTTLQMCIQSYTHQMRGKHKSKGRTNKV